MASKTLREIVRAEVETAVTPALEALENRISEFFEADDETPNLSRQDTRKAGNTAATRSSRAATPAPAKTRTNRVNGVRANKVYEVIPRKRNAEPKRPGDRQVFAFMLRHKKPVTRLDIMKGTKRSEKVVQNNLWRIGKEGLIKSSVIDRE